jgi:ABC-2 type transport system ATP-binding protein
VDQNLKLISDLVGYPEEKSMEIISNLKEFLDLNKFSDKKAKNLSGGSKRKLCFAISMVTEPKLVLLDEPTCGLDPLSRRQLYSFLKQ